MMLRQASAALIQTWIRLALTPSICKLARSRSMALPSRAAPCRLIPRRASLIPRILRSPQTISISRMSSALPQGIMRIGYLATGDSGHGFLNFASVFVMGGNTTGARFGGGTTGCALPEIPALPHATVLDPLGNLWVGFKKSGSIVRFNQPGTASETGFGTCDQFITPVATVDKISNGLAFIGHDLWGADGTSPFFIKNADTTCMVPPHGICAAPTACNQCPGAAAVGAAPTAPMSDQYYPATNGNNVYFSLSPRRRSFQILHG